MKEYRPCIHIPPFEHFKDFIDDKNMDYNEVCLKLQISVKGFIDYLQGKKLYDKNFATAMAFVCGIPPSFWIDLQENYMNDLVDEWHEGSTDCSLHEYIGISKESYRKWVEDVDAGLYQKIGKTKGG